MRVKELKLEETGVCVVCAFYNQSIIQVMKPLALALLPMVNINLANARSTNPGSDQAFVYQDFGQCAAQKSTNKQNQKKTPRRESAITHAV